MKNRVFGLIGISSIMSNWNADFTGRPKTTSKGDIFGSDKSLKYTMKSMWQNQGEKILYIKSLKSEKDSVSPRSLSERYSYLFNEKVPKENHVVINNLFKCLDVMNFGATFAEEKSNISITGAVQIGQGFNVYDDTRVEVQDILSPFRNSKNEDAGNSTLGTKITSDEAHYCYPFSIIPNNYNNYSEIIEGFSGYTRDAFEKFKKAARMSATAFATNSKMGCDNEYSIFIEMKDSSMDVLPVLSPYVKFEKKDGKNTLDISDLIDFISTMDSIESIEVYYNPVLISILDSSSFKLYKKLHILTGKEV